MSADREQQVFPPPVMLPPPVPLPDSDRSSSVRSSSGSSGRKRRRQEGPEVDSYAASASSASSEFNMTTKRKVDHLNPRKSCFHCGATPTNVCHVIGKKDRTFPELVKQGLISFQHLGHIDNAIPYCPLCHCNFDDLQKPGLILWPLKIAYFITYERKDFRHREARAQATGVIPPRTCPNAQMYLEHQIKNDEVDAGASGGLYVRYTLEDYLPQTGQDHSWIPGVGPFHEPKSWHGDPMAALHRCFHILGSPRPLLPVEVRRQLDELRNLYQRQIRIDDDVAGSSGVSQDDRDQEGSRDGAGDDGEGEDDDSQAPEEWHRRSPGSDRVRGSRGGAQADSAVEEEQGRSGCGDGVTTVADSGIFVGFEGSPSNGRDPKGGVERKRKTRDEDGDGGWKVPSGGGGRPRRKKVRRREAVTDDDDGGEGVGWRWGPHSSSDEKIRTCTIGPR